MAAATDPSIRLAGSSRLRVAMWVFHLALPVLGLWLVLAQPDLDAHWEHHAWHFWLVLATAVVNVGLALRMSRVARRRADARILLVTLAFGCAAGALGVHALATPGVIVQERTLAFVLGTPLGLLVAGGLAAVASFDLGRRFALAVLRYRRVAIGVLAGVLAAAVVASAANLAPVTAPIEEATGTLATVAIAGILLYGIATVNFYRLYRRRPSVVTLSVITSFTLLAEALAATALARNWAISWWGWHVLMAAAFGFVAYSVQVQAKVQDVSATGVFAGMALEATLAELRREYTDALETLVSAMARLEDGAHVAPIAARVANRFGLTEGQRDVLERAAAALAGEREQILHLGGLVAVGQEARLLSSEEDLLRRVIRLAADAFPGVTFRVGLLEDGRVTFAGGFRGGPVRPPLRSAETARDAALATLAPADAAEGQHTLLALPLGVKEHAMGVLEVQRERPFDDRERRLLETLASQVSVAVENARLYRELDGLFRQYMSPDVATALLADPSKAARLGGDIVELTVLFADLRGFTSFSEHTTPTDVVEMLNTYFGAAVPCVLAEGGTVAQFVGDAIVAFWNAPTRQPDHAWAACRAALAMQDVCEKIRAGTAGWPRFRIGVNTGPALVGNIGAEIRTYTAIGDAVNVAARLEEAATPGQVVIGEMTRIQIGPNAVVEPLGPLAVKGRSEPVHAWVLGALPVL